MQNIWIAIIPVVAFISGIGDGVLQESTYYRAYYISSLLVFAGLALAWYIVDTKNRDRPRSAGMSIAITGLPLVAVPVYLFRSRGAAKGALATLLFLFFVSGCILLDVLGTVLIVGVEGF